ncbi:MAG: ATP-NAD kinase family protein [Halobacteriales archaeon]
MRVGFVVNPIAGMGGRVGLKDTDGAVEQALERGAEPRAGERAKRALEAMGDVELLTAAGRMGADAARAADVDHEVVYTPAAGADAGVGETTADDTREAVERIMERDVDVVVFVGGDGTALDVARALASADVPALGVPAGVKVYSAVFATSPEAAGRTATSFTSTERREVVDADVEAYDPEPRVRGLLRVPVSSELQPRKTRVEGDVEGAVRGFVEEVEDDVTYVLGPGGTLHDVKRALGFEGTPLGVDVYRDGRPVVVDAAAEDVREALGDRNAVVVSPLGRQGFVLGRGNQQITPDVVRRSELVVLSSPEKLSELDVLRVDTGDPALDEELRGWLRVRVGRHEHRLVEVE